MHPRLRSLSVFLLLLAGSFVTYYYALADPPRRDQLVYMAERVLVETDWDWFWYSLSYSRTRFLFSGDHFLFRPLHMAVVVLKDILFRKNLFALGVINITMMALASYSLYAFASRLLKPIAAVTVALLFMVQFAGLEMVAWGHISSYLLALAFFGFAMSALLEAGAENKGALKRAGVFLLLGSLVHEMVAVALVLFAPLVLFVRWRAGKEASIEGIPLRSYILWVIAVPVLAYLVLNLFDFLYYGAPRLISIESDFASGGKYGPLGAIFTVAGTAAVAFLAPFKVELTKGGTGVLAWNFEDMRLVIIALGAVLSIAVAAGLYRSSRAMKRAGGGPVLALASVLVLLLFVGIMLGVGLGRIYPRSASYLYEATYYYSITAYIFCLILAIGINRLSNAGEKKISPLLPRAIIVAMVMLIAINFAKIRETLQVSWPEKKKFAQMHLALDEAFAEHSHRYCLAGSVAFADVVLQLLREQTCQKEDSRIHGYLATDDKDGSLWLAELEVKPIGTFGKPEEVSLTKISHDFMLSRDMYDRPDMALTVHNKAHIFLIFGYQNFDRYIQFELYGPRLSGEVVTADGGTSLMGLVNLPYADSTQRLEVRRGNNIIYLFVDGRLVASTPDYDRGPGKIGIAFERIHGNIEQAFSDFIVAPPTPKDERLLSFKPVVKLLDMSEIVFQLESQ